MRKHSLYIIAILLTIASLALILWLSGKNNEKREFKNNNRNITEENSSAEALREPENQVYPIEELEINENPSFNDVVAGGCCVGDCYAQKYNPYLGKKIRWKAVVSDYAHTSGIRFIVIDEDHPIESYENHGHFYGTFLVSADDPRFTDEGSEKWSNKWNLSWVNYILDVYGNIQSKDRDADTIFLVTADIDHIDCDKIYDGGYIETYVKKIEIIKK